MLRVAEDRRRREGVDDRDGRAAAVEARVEQRLGAVGRPQLRRRVAARRVGQRAREATAVGRVGGVDLLTEEGAARAAVAEAVGRRDRLAARRGFCGAAADENRPAGQLVRPRCGRDA